MSHGRHITIPGPRAYSDFEECLLAYGSLEKVTGMSGGTLRAALLKLLVALRDRAFELDVNGDLESDDEGDVYVAQGTCGKGRLEGC